MRFVDLFCGIGGFRLGLKGHQCVYSCDIEPLARSVYWQNFGDEPDTDIRALCLAIDAALTMHADRCFLNL